MPYGFPSLLPKSCGSREQQKTRLVRRIVDKSPRGIPDFGNLLPFINKMGRLA